MTNKDTFQSHLPPSLDTVAPQPFEACSISTTFPLSARYPYPGLRPFELYESDVFFGRKKHVSELLQRLKDQRFLAVVGPSGCGKSSLIRAGLIPSLQAGLMARSKCQWNFAVFRPGNQPLYYLAKAIQESGIFGDSTCQSASQLEASIRHTQQAMEAGSRSLADRLEVNEHAQGRNLLILVDQFEELFRFEVAGGGDESRAFVNLLLETARDPDVSAYVVLTMRTDFIGQCPVFTGLPEALNDSQYLTPRLTREQIESAIVGPARMFDSEVEPDVVNRILNEMGTDPDQLPLMQHLLMRMWRSATQRSGVLRATFEQPQIDGLPANLETTGVRLTMKDYNDTGGLRNALGQHAEGVYNTRLETDRDRQVAEQMFRRLTEVAPNAQLVRASPAPRFGELCQKLQATESEMRRVVDVFRREGRSFLMPPITVPLDQQTPIDISHESLIRNWQRLNDWTRDEALADQILTEVTKSAAEFEAGGQKSSDAAMPESRLALARDWAARHPLDVTPQVRKFLDACIKAQNREKSARLRLWIASGMILLLSISTFVVISQQQRTASVLSKRFWRDAVQQLSSADQGKENLAVALLWAAAARHEEPRLFGLANDREQLYEVRFNAILSQHPRLEEVGWFKGHSVRAYSPDFRYLVTVEPSRESIEPKLCLWDRNSTEEPLRKISLTQPLADVKFDPSGKFLLALSGNSSDRVNKLMLFKFDSNTRALELVDLLDAEDTSIIAADFVPRVDTDPGIAALVLTDELTNSDSDIVKTKLAYWSDFALAPASFAQAPTQATRETSQGSQSVSISPTQIVCSPDGRYVATWGHMDPSQCGGLCLWDLELLRMQMQDTQARSNVERAVFSKSGTMVAAINQAGQAQVWDVTAAKAITIPWPAHVGGGQKIQFSPSEDRVLTVGGDNVARVWNFSSLRNMPDPKQPQQPLIPSLAAALPHESDIYGASFSGDGQLLATAGRDRIARVWDVHSGQLAAPPLYHASGVDRVDFFEGSSSRLLTTSVSLSHVWNLSARNPAPRTLAPPETIQDVAGIQIAYSDNGRFAAVANIISGNVQIDVWDADMQLMVNANTLVQPHADSVSYLAVSGDGHNVLAVVSSRQTPGLHSGVLWCLKERANQTRSELWSNEPASRCCVGFAPDGQAIVVSREIADKAKRTGAGRLQLWSRKHEQAASPVELNCEQDLPEQTHVNQISWSSEGSQFVVASGKNEQTETKGAATLWQWKKSSQQLEQIHYWQHKIAPGQESSNGVLVAAFTHDNQYVITAGIDNTAFVWAAAPSWNASQAESRPVSPPLRHASDIVHIAISHDDRFLATSSVADMKCCIWNLNDVRIDARAKSATPLYTFAHTASLNRSTFSDDGFWLATASSDKLARVWSLRSGELAAQFQHNGNVRAIRFSEQDGRLITMSNSLTTDPQTQLPRESWPQLYTWHLHKLQNAPSNSSHIVNSARLLAAGELNEDRTSLRMLSGTSSPNMADSEYLMLWKAHGSQLFPPIPSSDPTAPLSHLPSAASASAPNKQAAQKGGN